MDRQALRAYLDGNDQPNDLAARIRHSSRPRSIRRRQAVAVIAPAARRGPLLDRMADHGRTSPSHRIWRIDWHPENIREIVQRLCTCEMCAIEDSNRYIPRVRPIWRDP